MALILIFSGHYFYLDDIRIIGNAEMSQERSTDMTMPRIQNGGK